MSSKTAFRQVTVIAGLVAAALALAFLFGRRAAGQPPAAPAAAVASSTVPTATLAALSLPPAVVETAAAALRRRDCTAALAALDPLAGGDGPEAAFARQVQGFYAHACEDVELAQRKLFAAADAAGPLEDWRLLVLADSAAALDRLPVARAALDRLLADHPQSPLRARALLRLAELAWSAGDAPTALEAVGRARREVLAADAAAGLEELAWTLGGAIGDPEIRREAGRRLLAGAPLEAQRLGVDVALRPPDGGFAAVLGTDGLMLRAESFLAADMPTAARQTLDEVTVERRGHAWHLLAARALSEERRGVEALRLLTGAPAASRLQQAELEWARALAALDAAAVYRRRSNLPAAERQQMQRAAEDHLRRVALLDADPELTARALSRLFREISDDAPFEVTLEVLERLRQVAPDDDRGAEHLWELGWSEYRRGNHSGAVGYWSELAGLYPEHRLTRSGRYWTGRAFEELGEEARARRIYAEIASADTTDFYRKHALARLGGGSRVLGGTLRDRLPEPWPEDPRLDRARLLSDLGLDELALSEIELVGAGADRRAGLALEALVLARHGERRDSINRIRQAFPALGGPYQAGLPAAALALYYPLDFEEVVAERAAGNGLPIHLVNGMIRQESAFDTGARSWAGAHGLMQVMPATGREVARRLGMSWATSRLRDPDYNLRLGTTYFRQVLSMFDDDLELALAGYNGGPYRIKRLWRQAGGGTGVDVFLEGLGIPESKTYVKRILVLSDSYRQLYPDGTRGDQPPVPGVY